MTENETCHRIGKKGPFANFSNGHAHLIDPSFLRMTGKLDVSRIVTKNDTEHNYKTLGGIVVLFYPPHIHIYIHTLAGAAVNHTFQWHYISKIAADGSADVAVVNQ